VNISKPEQRTLHVLAQGGRIVVLRDAHRHVLSVDCITRDGARLADCTPAVFKKLLRRGLVLSRGGGPYIITREGLAALRPQLDNRVGPRSL
jgi:uncharacterized protein YjhX (UPF0386 family)